MDHFHRNLDPNINFLATQKIKGGEIASKCHEIEETPSNGHRLDVHEPNYRSLYRDLGLFGHF